MLESPMKISWPTLQTAPMVISWALHRCNLSWQHNYVCIQWCSMMSSCAPMFFLLYSSSSLDLLSDPRVCIVYYKYHWWVHVMMFAHFLLPQLGQDPIGNYGYRSTTTGGHVTPTDALSKQLPKLIDQSSSSPNFRPCFEIMGWPEASQRPDDPWSYI